MGRLTVGNLPADRWIQFDQAVNPLAAPSHWRAPTREFPWTRDHTGRCPGRKRRSAVPRRVTNDVQDDLRHLPMWNPWQFLSTVNTIDS